MSYHTRGAFAIYTPKGVLMISTIAARPDTAKMRCLDPLEQKYKGLIERNFAKWAAQGYVCARVKIAYQKPSRF